MSNEIMSGKGSLSELENLHGKVAKAYDKGVSVLLSRIEKRDKMRENYEEEIKLAKQSGEPISDIPEPLDVGMTKEDLALLKNAQDFLSKNDIQVTFTKKNSGRQIRSELKKQIQEKFGG